MCGISGFIQRDAVVKLEQMQACATAMADRLRHRGPDDGGAWVEAGGAIALSYRRLAIVDLSELGRQPMRSADGRHVLVYNGEIYNHRELRELLAARGVRFRGSSDTEVLVEAIAAWGVREAVERANGMFAFAVWDTEERILTLARDRLGEKPLYLGRFGRSIVFGSELSALEAHPAFRGDIDPRAVRALLDRSCIPAPLSIYEHVEKLPPGHLAHIGADLDVRLESYWDVAEVARAGLEHPIVGDQVRDEIRSVLSDSIRLRLHADVPVGAFLSGGIDSPLLVALAREHDSEIRTFTIGFEDAAYDESAHARAIANHLGTRHEELSVTEAEVIDGVHRLPTAFDEPFADSSQLPTLAVAALTRHHVTVALAGDGADELFGGYSRYRIADSRAWRTASRAPARLRRGAAALVERAPLELIDRVAAAPALRGRFGVDRPGTKLGRFATAMGSPDVWEAYADLMRSGFPGERAPLPDVPALDGPLSRMLLSDQRSYLPDDLLVKTDRATMAVSLEGRLPYLDHRLVELSWRVPGTAKLVGATGKVVLRELLAEHLPRELFDRPKTGFGVPLGRWLRGPLRSWADELVRGDDIDELVPQHPVARLWKQHLDGLDRSRELWPALVLRQWRRAK